MTIATSIIKKKLIIWLDDTKSISSMENDIIKQVHKIKKTCKRHHLKLDFKTNDKMLISPSLITLKKAINATSVKEETELIYDYACFELEKKLSKGNWCEFIDGRCVVNRMHPDKYPFNGCCYRYKKGTCSFLMRTKCTTSNISCKLFMCSHLRTKGIEYNINDFPLVKFFFNFWQKQAIKFCFFKSKEEIIEVLVDLRKIKKILTYNFRLK